MNTRTLKALKASIAHWDRLASGKRIGNESTSGEDCALCSIYWDADCKGCPVSKKTHSIACLSSPWSQASAAGFNYGLDSPEFKRAAKAELAFLKSLLPKKTKSKP